MSFNIEFIATNISDARRFIEAAEGVPYPVVSYILQSLDKLSGVTKFGFHIKASGHMPVGGVNGYSYEDGSAKIEVRQVVLAV